MKPLSPAMVRALVLLASSPQGKALRHSTGFVVTGDAVIQPAVMEALAARSCTRIVRLRRRHYAAVITPRGRALASTHGARLGG